MNPIPGAAILRQYVKELGETQIKLIKGANHFLASDKIEAGSSPKELIYEKDKLKLYHYRSETQATCRVPVLIVYALINRPYMLDLQPDRSLVKNLLGKGIDLYLIDWGYPTMADRYLTMEDYICGYMDNCVEMIRKNTGKEKITMMGICQGGTFSAIYTALFPQKMRNLITLVAPIDFSAKDGLLFSWSKQMNVDAIIDTYRIVPGDFLNAGYLMLLPFNLYVKKYKDMLSFVDDEEKLSNFLRMEKWIFDSPGQAGECLRQFLKDLYQENRLVKGTLKIGDRLVNLNKITVPLLNIYATYDHLVPPASSRPLNDLVSSSDKSSYEFKGGHIGVFVSEKSQEELGPAIARWLHAHDQQVKSDGLPEKASGRAKTHYKSRTTSSKMKSSRPE